VAAVKVTAPVRDYAGVVAGVTFKDGEAEFDPAELPGALGYFQDAGYTVAGYEANEPALSSAYEDEEPEAPAPGTPANPTGIIGGVPPRDAAIEGADAAGPVSDAFLPPTNAGQADPHGPHVVAPGIHAVGPAPIVPGPVLTGDRVDEQERRETAVAEAVLVDNTPVPVVMDHVTEAMADGPLTADVAGAALASSSETEKEHDAEGGRDVADNRAEPAGPLRLSDPASVGVPEALADEAPAPTDSPERPARAERKSAWVDYGVAQGDERAELEALTKDELVERYGS
jgi:hypothetical protein